MRTLLLSVAFKSANLNGHRYLQKYHLAQSRGVLHAHYAPRVPRPPPREYEADGTLRRYGGNALLWDHGIHWTRWRHQHAGMFHMYHEGETAEMFGPRGAYREQFRWWNQWIPLLTIGWFFGFVAFSIDAFGIAPLCYTEDWINSQREKDRAENAYPISRYLDRRRKERGPHFLAINHPNNINFLWQSGARDTRFLRARAIKARKIWLEQEKRKEELQQQDEELEAQFENEDLTPQLLPNDSSDTETDDNLES